MRKFIGLALFLAVTSSGLAQTHTSVMTPFGRQNASSGAAKKTAPQQEHSEDTEARSVCVGCSTKVFSLRYINSRSIGTLLKPFDVRYEIDSSLNAISVNAPDKTLNAIEEVIKRFDVPANAPKQVDVTVYLVLGSPQAEPDTIPSVLKPVIDQLRNVMAYKSYRILDTIILTGKEGDRLSESGTTPKISENDQPSLYNFSATPRVITGDSGERLIHFENLSLDLSTPGRPGGGSIHTAVDVKKDQQVVIGKTTVQDRAVILVLSARIIG